jgi:hypothetical protein
MSSSEEVINNMTDNAIYEPLQKDVEAVKNAISALTNQISDALNSFAGTAEKQARGEATSKLDPTWRRLFPILPNAAAPLSMLLMKRPTLLRNRSKMRSSSAPSRPLASPLALAFSLA